MEAHTINCQNCQTPNPAKNLYCQSCGKPLTQAAPLPVASPPANLPIEPAPLVSPVGEAEFSSQLSSPMPDYQAPGQVSSQIKGQEPEWQGAPQSSGPPQGYRPQELPPQQPAYYPPSPPPPAPPPAVPTLENLGVWKDGWADLIAGEGSKAEELEKEFVESIKMRDIPMVMVEKVEFAGKFNKKDYLVVRNPGGAVTVQIGSRGNDLSLGWSLYTRHIPNWRMIAILAVIAFAVSFLNSLGTFNFGVFFVNWVFGTFSWLMPVAILALGAGYLWKGSLWYFFLENPGDIAIDELTALTIAVHQSIHTAVEKAGLDVGALRLKSAFRVGNRQ